MPSPNEKPTVEINYPPIPVRSFDYCAYYDAESGPYGYGATEADALADLEDRLNGERRKG